MNNRIWQAAIVVLLHCTMASAHSFEVDGIYYSITSSADSTVAVTYRGNNYGSYSNEYSGVITIPKTVTYDGKTYKVTSIAQYTFYKCDITSVTLHEGIIEIGDGAFCKCSSLTSIMIPEGVTSIGDSFFSGCSSLTFIDIPKGVTEIGGNAFSECRSLTSITIPHKVKAIGDYAFYRCTSIKEVIIEDGCDTLQLGENTTGGLFFDCPLETIYLGRNINYRYGKSYGYSPFFRNNNYPTINIGENVTFISPYLFYNNANLTSFTIPDGITSIKIEAFSGCSNLISIDIPSAVTEIEGSAFSNCGKLQSVIIGNGVESIGSKTFYNCSSLSSVTIGNSVKEIGMDAFYKCGSLTSIVIPDNVTKIGQNAFQFCSNLTSITIGKGLKEIAYQAFGYCEKLKEVHINSLENWCNIDFSTSESNPLYYAKNLYLNGKTVAKVSIPKEQSLVKPYSFINCNSLVSVTLPEGLTSIGDSAFSGCRNLAFINLPEGITTIESWAFWACGSLASINLPETLTSIGSSAFSSCSNLKSIDIPSKITQISSSTFQNCENLLSISLPEGITEIGESAFYRCGNLSSINIPQSITSIGEQAFYGCSRMCSVNLPRGVEKIGDKAFQGCAGELIINCNVPSCTYGAFFGGAFTKVTIGDSVTFIGNNAFSECKQLSSVHINSIDTWCNIDFFDMDSNPLYYAKNLYQNENLVKDLEIPENITAIKDYTFFNCNSLASITLPKSLGSIGERSFYNCTSLDTIFIPEGTSTIGQEAFRGCSNLNKISLPSSITAIRSNAFENCTGELIVNCDIPIASSNFNGTFCNSKFSKIIINEGVNLIGDYAFYDCNTIHSVLIPKSVTTIGGSAFSGCSNLAVLNIPKGVIQIGNFAFAYCRLLTSIFIPESVTSIGSCAFSGCSNLATVVMEDGVTSIESSTFSNCPKLANIILPRYLYSIGENAFSKCSMLENITIPNSVEIIYQEAFEDCDNLKMIRLLSIAPPLAYDNSFDSYDVILYVPESSIDTYKKTAPWSNFEEIIALTPPITYLELNHTHVLLAEEESFLITTNIASNRDDIPLVWSSDAPDIATVNSEGKVTAIKAGVAKITVTANDGSGLSAICEVEVQKHYVLKYIIEDEVYYTSSVAAGAIITLPEEPTKEGHTFSGWSEVPETMPAKDVTVTGHFTINKYLVTFKIGDEVIAADSLEYGATIVAPEAPDREGYTFDGWGEVAETVPANDVTYEGTYTVNIYKVYYYVGEELVHTAEVAYGEAIPEYVYEPTEAGYTFLGWIGDTYETMPAHDVTYTANIDDAIEQLTIDKSQLTIYDLKGRKVTDTESLKGGIYIVNGKKVVIE